MRHIVVSKFGNEPDIFGNSLRCGMIGDWEVRKLLLVLSKDKNNFITYYGKAKWNQEEARKLFVNNNVQFIESSENDSPEVISKLAKIDEFHVLLGPHAFYNGGLNIPSWESIKTSIVTQRLLERVAPQIKLMNANTKAPCYFYLSDRRFLLQAADLLNDNITVLAQSLRNFEYSRVQVYPDDYSRYFLYKQPARAFRFDTLWLLDKDKYEFDENMCKDFGMCKINLVVPANQVTSDAEISNSRLDKLKFYLKDIAKFTVIGKWTNEEAREFFIRNSRHGQYLDGLDIDSYNDKLKHSKYALVTYNTADSPSIFLDNYLTPKYWECAYNGCLTFVEATFRKTDLLPEELQVLTGDELRDKLDKCNNDIEYKNKLLQLQYSLVKPEYFSGQYFLDTLNKYRSEQCKYQ